MLRELVMSHLGYVRVVAQILRRHSSISDFPNIALRVVIAPHRNVLMPPGTVADSTFDTQCEDLAI